MHPRSSRRELCRERSTAHLIRTLKTSIIKPEPTFSRVKRAWGLSTGAPVAASWVGMKEARAETPPACEAKGLTMARPSVPHSTPSKPWAVPAHQAEGQAQYGPPF